MCYVTVCCNIISWFSDCLRVIENVVDRVVYKWIIMSLSYFDLCHDKQKRLVGSNKILIDSMSRNLIDSVVIQIKNIIE